ncbi:hypothetical protein AB0N07_17120 [Streptomyces sp. NPDC051172]
MTQNLLLRPTAPAPTHRPGRPHGAHTQTALTSLRLTPTEQTTPRDEGAV